MPAAVKADWDLAKVLYAQGHPVQKIADNIGVSINTLRGRIVRHKWTKLKAGAEAALDQKVKEIAVKSLGERAKRFTEKVANITEEHVSIAGTLNAPKNTKELRAQAETLAIIQKTGRTAFGLDQQGPSTIINVGVMTQAKDNIIDIESEST